MQLISCSWWSLAIVAGMLYYLWMRRKRPKNYPPGTCGIPVLGALPLLFPDVPQTLMKWAAKYGPIFYVQIGNKDWIVLNDYESFNKVRYLFFASFHFFVLKF